MFDIILVDFSWLYNKYYFVAKTKVGSEGVEEELLNMLTTFLFHVKKAYPKPTKIFLVLDSPTSELINAPIYEGYKQNRDKEGKKEVYSHLNYIIGNLSKLDRITFIKSNGYEADQVIAFLAEKYSVHDELQPVKTVLVYSGDKDLLQLTYHKEIRVSDKFKDGRFLTKSDKEIFEKFKNTKGEDFTRISEDKRDILKYRVLKGDPSDNLSPVFPRIKDTEIAEVIKSYWIDYEELTEERINDILDDIEGDNIKLAEKLRQNTSNWIRNYKLMNIQGLEGLKIVQVKGKE